MAKPIINIKFLADLKQFSSQMQNANRSLKRTGRNMQRLGTSLTVGLTAPLTALAAVSLKNFDAQEKAIAQVNAGLRSTGNAVGYTTEQLQKQASALQNNTLFGDEDILKNVTAQLLTFTNIAGQEFSRTQQAALDLATRLDGDLKSASIQLGKALNDPVANLSALSRSGIQFSKSQKETINALVATNQLAEAQTIILDELEKQYGGSAAAAAKAGTGPLTQLKNILGDITEELGAIIAEGINPFVEKLKAIALRFSELSPTTKKWIVILGGIAAAIGPLLALAGTILPAIGTGLALLTGPIGLIVAGLTAIGVVIYKKWAPIKKTLIDIANYFIDLYNESTVFRIAVESIIFTFKTLFRIGTFVFDSLASLLRLLADNIKTSFTSVGKIVKGALTFDYDLIKEGISDAFDGAKENVGKFVENIKGDFAKLSDSIEDDLKNSIANVATRTKIKFLKENVDAEEVGDAVKEAAEGAGVNTNPSPSGVADDGVNIDDIEIYDNQALEDFLTEQGALVDAAVADGGILGSLAEKNAQDLDLIDQEFESWLEEFNAKTERMAEIGRRVGSAVGGAFQGMASNIVESMGLANTGFQGFVKGMIQTVTKLISMLLSQSIAQAIAGATASGTATGPAAVFTTPGFIATAVSGVLAAFAAIPKFADGGIVTGPTLALVGEYSGARSNPEVIAPLDKLKDMIQPQVSPTDYEYKQYQEIHGEKIVLVSERYLKNKNRRS